MATEISYRVPGLQEGRYNFSGYADSECYASVTDSWDNKQRVL